VNRRLLRYYEEQGLLGPVRLANGYREYTESDVAAVRHIRSLLAAGLPTMVIARLLHCVHDEGGRMVPSACPDMITNL
jgi:DNA-binding transcriptional MerR regulator